MEAVKIRSVAAVAYLGVMQFICAVTVSAETYVGGHIGVTLPQKNATDTEVTTGALPGNTPASNISFQNSLNYGLRVGHYFEAVQWFGLEAEGFSFTPHLTQQTIQVYPSGPGASQQVALRGESARVVAGAVNLLFRSADERFKAQPYAGLGIGVFSGRLHDGATDESRTSIRAGVNGKAGVRYRLADHVRAFGEYRFNYVRFNFDRTANLPGISTTFIGHTFAVGLEYSF